MKAWLRSIGIEPLPPEARPFTYIYAGGFLTMVALLSAAAALRG